MAGFSWPDIDTVDIDYRHAVFCSKDGTNDGSASDDGKLQGETISAISDVSVSPATGLADDGGALTSVSIQGVTYSANTVVTVGLTASVNGEYVVSITVTTSDTRTLNRSFAIVVRDL